MFEISKVRLCTQAEGINFFIPKAEVQNELVGVTGQRSGPPGGGFGANLRQTLKLGTVAGSSLIKTNWSG
jgi:hypothetical protein